MRKLRKNSNTVLSNFALPSVVATVHSPTGLRAASKLRPGDADVIELRVDAFVKSGDLNLLASTAPKLWLPRIVTVRHPREGGAASGLRAVERGALFEQFLPLAALVDVELRSARELSPIHDLARATGAGIILSHHDFQRTPPLGQLEILAHRAKHLGADIFKVAALARSPRDVAVLLEFLARKSRSGPPLLSVMAMGPFGKVSRLLFARCGSVLNYGFLGTANASGQWQAKILKQRLTEL